jgi:molecular chaperone GrpE
VLDNLERALSHAGEGGQEEKVAEGVALVLKSFQDLLRQHGAKPVAANPGDVFDPALHEAVDRRETRGEANRIVEVWQRGYQLHDRLLRPARVVVSASRPAAPASNGHDIEKDDRRG